MASDGEINLLKEHWQQVYSLKKADEVSWYQRTSNVDSHLSVRGEAGT